MVLTQLKNISQIGSFPQAGVKMNQCLQPPPRFIHDQSPPWNSGSKILKNPRSTERRLQVQKTSLKVTCYISTCKWPYQWPYEMGNWGYNLANEFVSFWGSPAYFQNALLAAGFRAGSIRDYRPKVCLDMTHDIGLTHWRNTERSRWIFYGKCR